MKGLLPVRWRHARWAVVAAALPLVWACNTRRLEPPTPNPTRTFNNVYQEAVNRDIDILFMIDTSQSMTPLQTKLATNFPAFMNVLKALPGGLPNVHVGIVSSDMGAGQETGVQGCRPGGDAGSLQTAPRAPCMASGLMPGQSFIQSVNGMQNFTGDIADVFSCMARLGDAGCGFEHQFASVLKALEGNTQFLRPNAYLSIILITNEDDCSAPADTDLFNPMSRLVGDALGPLASFRCNQYGHLCGGMQPPRAMAELNNCVSAEDGRLMRVSEAIARTKALKADPMKILVAAIAGPVSPYRVNMVPAGGAGGIMEDQPQVAHSCTTPPPMPGAQPEYGDPSIRIKQWIDAFPNGIFLPICQESFAPALQNIAMKISQVIGPKCINGPFLDKDPVAAGTQYDCRVADRAPNPSGVLVETPVPACDESAAGTFPCWQLVDSPNCQGGRLMQIQRTPPGMMPPPATELNTRVECAICIPGSDDPRCQ